MEKANDMARQTEAVKKQQSNLHRECVNAKTAGSIERVISKSKSWLDAHLFV